MNQETFSHAIYWRASERELELRVIGNPQLHEDALCPQTDPDVFFPEKGGSTRDAKRVCGACAVRSACLDYALKHDEEHGIWGGLSKKERDAEKERRARYTQEAIDSTS
jgi:hypothetical protein